MKRGIILICLLLLPAVQAIGVTPSSDSINFRPNLVKEIPFNFFPTNANNNINIILTGDLAQYATLSTKQLTGGGIVLVKISLPNVLEPGQHSISVHGSEQPADSSGIFAISGITVPIRIFVPYHGKFIEASLEIPNLNINEEGTIKIHVKNIGSKAIHQLYSKISILNNENVVKTLETNKLILPVEQTKTLQAKFSTKDLKEGSYKAIATIFFDDQEESLEKEFIIGDLIVSIINYTKTVTEHKINKFYITIESKWNNPINEVFADISISQNNNKLLTSTTPTTSLGPREVKQLETFLELTEISAGRYDIEFLLHYANKQSSLKGQLSVIKKEPSTTTIATITIIAILVLLIVWYVLLKKKTKGSKKHAKKS